MKLLKKESINKQRGYISLYIPFKAKLEESNNTVNTIKSVGFETKLIIKSVADIAKNNIANYCLYDLGKSSEEIIERQKIVYVYSAIVTFILFVFTFPNSIYDWLTKLIQSKQYFGAWFAVLLLLGFVVWIFNLIFSNEKNDK